MSLLSKIKQKTFSEFIEIIEWIVHTPQTIVWQYCHHKAHIKNGAKLKVRKEQVAILVNEGQFADVYQPGHYELTPVNMPILATLKGWKYDFSSPFKVDVYFVNTKQFLNFHWGTTKPIKLSDSEFGPIRIRAFGSYCFRVHDDPIVFLRRVVGTDGNFTTESIADQLRNFVVNKLTDYLTESKIVALDFATNLDELSSKLTIALKSDFSHYGIELTTFSVEKILLPEAVEVALKEHTNMGIVGKMTTYAQMQFAHSHNDATNN